jgi:tetratricopeptide (TPR) repeat protein
VVHICRLAEGVPLAILLAATWIEILTPAEIAEELGRGIDFLETDLRDMPARHRSMRAVLDASWRLLSSRQRMVLRALSVFRGGFTRTAAQATTQSSLRDLMGLTHKSLLWRTASGRYDLAHELLRQYATDKLEASGQGHAVRDAHCACYAQFLGERWADLQGRRQLAALDEIEADFENARAAWTWALDQRDFASVDRMLDSLDWFCVLRNRNLEHGELFGRAREELAPDPACGGEAHLVWGRVLVADHYTRPHDLDSAPGDRVRIERALGIARRYGDRGLTAWGLRTLGHIAGVLEDYAASLSLYGESLNIYQEMGDRFQEAGCLSQLAQVHRMLGQPERSIEPARQGLALAREIGDSFWVAVSLINTGSISFYTGNYAEAEQYYGDALASYRQLGHRQGVAQSDGLLGRLAFLRGDFRKTRALAREALEIATDLGHRRIAERARDLDSLVAATLGEEIPQSSGEQEPAPETEVPAYIDRFQVKRLLGAGGMALVYLAHDPDAGRDVAIRVPKPELMEHGWTLDGLRREANTMTRLKHPAIPKCYGYVDREDLAYIVVEFIDGKDLEAIFEEQAGFLPPSKVIVWAVQICDALTYLHHQRPVPFIFRDMKPSNVILDQRGRIHLTDFGITVANQPGREHTMVGTAGYSPPEQYLGYTDARSDVYALGTTMHHLLTRRDPRKERPFSFHDAPPRSLNPAVSEALEAVVIKATEHNPLNRYQSAEEMRAALLGCL